MKTVDIKDCHLLIDGKPVTLLSSSLFYFRIPPMYWEERMRQLKAAGYRAIDVYIPWNFHERTPGVWDFEGMRNIGHFLRLAKENDLFVIARPGPYICSEWDGGALPAWLGLNRGRLRQYDKEYLEAVKGWFDRIFPILHQYQYTQEGSVILVQIENELDIYYCQEPKLYLHALRQMTEAYGLTIPFVVCTSSQLDVDYSGGTAQGSHPAFNIYSTPDHVALEEKMERIRTELEKAGEAFLTTETMRQHAFLKRELLGGIRLLSPYCQTASANYDCYTGISTWGNDRERPVSYMTNDYDHGAMIKADGNVTEEYLSARLLGNMIAALGEELAAGTPCRENPEGWYLKTEEGKWAERPGILRLAHGGWLVGAANLGDSEQLACLVCGTKQLEVWVGAHETAILPVCLPLSTWGLPGACILCSSLELLTVERISEQGEIRLTVYGNGTGIWIGEREKEWLIRPGESRRLELEGGILLVEAIFQEEAVRRRTAFLPAFAERMDGEKEPVSEKEILGRPFLPPQHSVEGKITWMEEYGAWDGSAFYSFRMPENSCGLLLYGASDIVKIQADGRYHPAFYGTGNMLYIPMRAQQIEIKTECWGHNCGHGIGYPVAEMGSLRGIGKAWGLLKLVDIQYNWNYHVMPQSTVSTLRLAARKWPAIGDFGDRLPLAAQEMHVWQKELRMPQEGDTRFLYLEGGELRVRVYLNGELAGELTKEKNWLDITARTWAGEWADVVLAYDQTGLNPVPGHVYLAAASEISEGRLGFWRVEELKKLRPGKGEVVSLPQPVPDGRMLELTLQLPLKAYEGPLWLGFEGKGLKLTVVCSGLVLGRIFAGCDMPGVSVCSGDPDRVWIPEKLLGQDRSILVLAEALEENAVLERILLEAR